MSHVCIPQKIACEGNQHSANNQRPSPIFTQSIKYQFRNSFPFFRLPHTLPFFVWKIYNFFCCRAKRKKNIGKFYVRENLKNKFYFVRFISLVRFLAFLISFLIFGQRNEERDARKAEKKNRSTF